MIGETLVSLYRAVEEIYFRQYQMKPTKSMELAWLAVLDMKIKAQQEWFDGETYASKQLA